MLKIYSWDMSTHFNNHKQTKLMNNKFSCIGSLGVAGGGGYYVLHHTRTPQKVIKQASIIRAFKEEVAALYKRQVEISRMVSSQLRFSLQPGGDV